MGWILDYYVSGGIAMHPLLLVGVGVLVACWRGRIDIRRRSYLLASGMLLTFFVGMAGTAFYVLQAQTALAVDGTRPDLSYMLALTLRPLELGAILAAVQAALVGVLRFRYAVNGKQVDTQC